MLKEFASRILARITGNQMDRFLDEVLDLHCRLEGLPRTPGVYSAPASYWKLRHAVTGSGPVAPDDVTAWAEILAPIKAHYPDAEGAALLWICNFSARTAKHQARAQQHGQAGDNSYDPLPILLALVRLSPPPGAANVLADWFLENLRALVTKQAQLFYHVQDGVRQALQLLAVLDGEERGRRRELVQEVVTLFAGVRKGGVSNVQSSSYDLAYYLISRYTVPLFEAGRLSESELDALLLEFPRMLAHFGRQRPPEHAGWVNACDAAVGRFLTRALAGDPDLHLLMALGHYGHFKGIDHFLAACRFIDMNPQVKVSVDQWGGASGMVGWAARLLRMLPAPGPADLARAPELGAISAQTLQTATLLAPSWAPLADAHVGWPAWSKLVGWLARYGGIAPWSDGAQPSQEDEEDGGAVDRETLQEAFAAMGEKCLKQLLKHRIARALYRNGLFYAEAALGRTAAEVEARFLKRDKLAVVALGMLPDEGDILQRYLALRKFAKESRQFGAQRQASEGLAVERALANLAVTAGYEDRAQLEWSMEAQLVEELDPGRRWQVGEYTVWLEADEAATIRVERDGKPLKSVPPAVRQAEEYAEIKEAREQLQAQWDRVRRRLEIAMVLGEVMDRETFAPALITPAGQAMLPHLVLRSWAGGEPVLAFGPVPGAERYQIAHALDLAAEGALAAWQTRVIAEAKRQPFNQLFREYYTAARTDEVARFAGRKVRVGTLLEKLKRRGWHTAYEGALVRRLPGRGEASFWFEDGAAYMGAMEILTVGSIYLKGDVTQRIVSEVLRDVDLATRAAAPDQPGPVSAEVLAARAALARAHGAEVEGEYAEGRGWRLHLGTGAAFAADGNVVELRIPEGKGDFPYADPDAAMADFMARLIHLARRK